jgi:hypothetical protein
MHIKFWSENLKGGDHSEDLHICGRIILESIREMGLVSWLEKIQRNVDVIYGWPLTITRIEVRDQINQHILGK